MNERKPGRDTGAVAPLGVYLGTRPPSMAEIARAAGCSRQFIWRIANGRAKATPRVIDACRKLGIPVELVFGEARGPGP